MEPWGAGNGNVTTPGLTLFSTQYLKL